MFTSLFQALKFRRFLVYTVLPACLVPLSIFLFLPSIVRCFFMWHWWSITSRECLVLDFVYVYYGWKREKRRRRKLRVRLVSEIDVGNQSLSDTLELFLCSIFIVFYKQV